MLAEVFVKFVFESYFLRFVGELTHWKWIRFSTAELCTVDWMLVVFVCFASRRSPVVVLLTINSPPPSCCGSRQPRLALVPWIWVEALQDRYVAKLNIWAPGYVPTVYFYSFVNSILVYLFTDRKRWNGWRVYTPHCQHRPPCRSQYYDEYPAHLTFLSACLKHRKDFLWWCNRPGLLFSGWQMNRDNRDLCRLS